MGTDTYVSATCRESKKHSQSRKCSKTHPSSSTSPHGELIHGLPFLPSFVNASPLSACAACRFRAMHQLSTLCSEWANGKRPMHGVHTCLSACLTVRVQTSPWTQDAACAAQAGSAPWYPGLLGGASVLCQGPPRQLQGDEGGGVALHRLDICWLPCILLECMPVTCYIVLSARFLA